MKRVEGVTEKILACAKQEFLSNGYENASLRNIAKNADSSKGAIYIRYPDKASLFKALVQPTIDEFIEILVIEQGGYNVDDDMKRLMSDYSDKSFDIILNYIYDHADIFKLLLSCTDSKGYTDFMHRIVKQDVECTIRSIKGTNNDAITSGRMDEQFAHIASHAFYTGLFELVLHNISKEEAQIQLDRLRRFFKSGWQTILNIEGGLF
ncbi:TetR/AcrR family transcriptional regulator [Clostridiaceae bacterium M8S5]|nr:TetR/AcrR family transcriptional regulator [Clostridiaceae bacterium M8S5]